DLYEKVKEAAESLVGGLSMEAVDVEVTRQGGRLFLKLLIDKDGGVTVDDCATANNLLGEIIERDELITGPYILEVMSPGLDRPLKKPSDFVRSIGKRVQCRPKDPAKSGKSVIGVIEQADEIHVVVRVGEELVDIDYDDLSAARLNPELPW
ncbi:MAG: ribosome maturation factor RimP, partial [Actinobacteria bacterium]|nr:ribosome maturation factor RimP [Actinomycetota bacterium]